MNLEELVPSQSELAEMIFHKMFATYYDYLETLANFFENEREKVNQSVEKAEKTSSRYLVDFSAFHEWTKKSEQLKSISEFENTLFRSFFVTIYFNLEANLIRTCRYVEKESKEKLLLSDIAGNGIQKAMTYLIKVHRIDFSLGSNPNWEKIQNYNILRNCIVHNEGRLDDGFEGGQKAKLLKFIQKPNSKLILQNSQCLLNKEFCLEALDTIKAFLFSVLTAETKQ